MNIFKNRISGSFLFFCGLIAFGKAGFTQSDETPRFGADVIEEINDVRHLNGNVWIKQGALKLNCDKGTWFLSDGRINLRDNVIVEDGDKTLSSDFLDYFQNEKRLVARGHVTIVDSVRTIEARRMTYWREEEHVIAEQNVKIIESDRNVILTGGHAEYFRKSDSAFVTFNPVFIQTDSTGKEDIRVTGNLMELTQHGEVAIVTDSVRITRESTEATCGKAEFWRNLYKIVLLKEPKVWQENRHVTGDSIELHFDQNDLKQVLVKQNAEVLSVADSLSTPKKWHKLSGQLMTIFFRENRMKKIIVDNMATSWYYFYEDNKYKGLNKVSGDKLIIFLEDNKISRVRVQSDPGLSSGAFTPPGIKITENVKKSKK